MLSSTRKFGVFLKEEGRARLHPQGTADQAAAFRVVAHRKRQDHLLRRLRFADGRRPEGSLLHRGAQSRYAIVSGPYLEGFKARNLEVLFCYEAVDEYVMNNVREFDGKKLVAADHADVKLADLPQPPEGALDKDAVKALESWLKETSATCPR